MRVVGAIIIGLLIFMFIMELAAVAWWRYLRCRAYHGEILECLVKPSE